MILTPVVFCVGQHFTMRRAGVVVSSAAIGGIVFPIALNRLLNHHHGWSVRVTWFIMLTLLIYTALVTKEFTPHRQKNVFRQALSISGLINSPMQASSWPC